jgi:hypothetical protein
MISVRVGGEAQEFMSTQIEAGAVPRWWREAGVSVRLFRSRD